MFLSKAHHRVKPGHHLGLYREHQHIAALFNGDDDGLRPFLYRRTDATDVPTYYVLSNQPPQTDDSEWQIQSKAFNPIFSAGQTLAFSLRVNPVITVKSKSGKQQRHDVIMHRKHQLRTQGHTLSQAELEREAGLDWLAARKQRLGFDFQPGQLLVSEYRQLELHKPKAQQPIRISSLDFSGQLVVTDPEHLLTALQAGIGPAKGFGCGLLLLRRC